MKRPAETFTAAAAIAYLIADVAGLDDPTTKTALTVVVGFVPAAITWIVARARGEGIDPAA